VVVKLNEYEKYLMILHNMVQ